MEDGRKFEAVYERVEFEKEGKKAYFPAMRGTVCKFDLREQIESMITAGISDTEILETIRDSEAIYTCHITSAGNVKGEGKYGTLDMSEDEIKAIRSLKSPRNARSSVSLAETFAIRTGESRNDYVKRIYRENGGKFSIEEIARQYEVQSISDSEIEKALANL